MEPLQRLTRRQLDALKAIALRGGAAEGAPLKAIAQALEVQPPSALLHVTPLESMGLVIRHRGKSRLTPRGQNTLEEYRRHHRVAENLFNRLGLSPEAGCAAAREVDLALSHRTIERLCDAEGHPSSCPHGQPIPPCATERSGGRP